MREKRLLILLICVCVVLSVLLFIVRSKPSRKISAHDIAQQTMASTETLVNSGIGDVFCENNKCENVPLRYPHLAWRLLAASSAYHATGDEKFKAEAASLVQKIIQDKERGIKPYWSIRHLFEGFKVVKDPALADLIAYELNNLEDYLNYQTSESRFKEDYAMVGGELIRSLLAGYEAYGNEDFLRVISRNMPMLQADLATEASAADGIKELSPRFENIRSRFVDLARKLLVVIRQRVAAGDSVLELHENFKMESCWLQLALMDFANKLGDADARKEAEDFFRHVKFRDLKAGKLRIPILQGLIPCFEALVSLDNNSEGRSSDLHADLVSFGEAYLLPVRGSLDTRVPEEQGQIFLSGQAKSSSELVSMADNSWLIAVLFDSQNLAFRDDK